MKFFLFLLFLLCLYANLKIKETFDKIDVNKDGRIDAMELYNNIKDSKEAARNLIEIFDMDGDELLDLEEYKEFYESNH